MGQHIDGPFIDQLEKGHMTYVFFFQQLQLKKILLGVIVFILTSEIQDI
jgi:hypothetical protein